MKKGLVFSQKLNNEHRLRALRWEELRGILERNANTQRNRNEVDLFLWEHGLQQYCELMHQHAIEDFEILNELSEKHLADIGVALGHRIKLLKRLKDTEKPLDAQLSTHQLTRDPVVVCEGDGSVHKGKPVTRSEKKPPLSSTKESQETDLQDHLELPNLSLCQQYTPSVEIQEAQRKAASRPYSARQKPVSSGSQLRPASAKLKSPPWLTVTSLNGWD